MSGLLPPIEVTRRGLSRLVAPTREEFNAAVRWAGHLARRTRWNDGEKLMLFIAAQVQRQLGRGVGVVDVGTVIETGKPHLAVMLSNGTTEFLEVAPDTVIASAEIAPGSLPASLKRPPPHFGGTTPNGKGKSQ